MKKSFNIIVFIAFFSLILCAAPKKKIVKKPVKKQVKIRKDVRVFCAGDLMLDWGVAETIETKGPKYLFAGLSRFLKGFDYRFCNLECPISGKGDPHPEKKYIFLANPAAIDVLKAGNINGVSLANNHSYDYGKKALIETMTNLYKNGIDFTGAGMNIGSAHLPLSFEMKRMKFAVLAYSIITDGTAIATDTGPGITWASTEQIIEDIKQFRSYYNFILVSLHWGFEYSIYPFEEQIDMAHSIIDAGADAIIGHHPHIYQGIEIYKNRPVFYSLGNFIFGSINEDIKDNIVIELRFLKRKLISFSLFPISGNKNTDNPFQVKVLKGRPAGIVLNDLIRISKQLGHDFPNKVVVKDSHLVYSFKRR